MEACVDSMEQASYAQNNTMYTKVCVFPCPEASGPYLTHGWRAQCWTGDIDLNLREEKKVPGCCSPWNQQFWQSVPSSSCARLFDYMIQSQDDLSKCSQKGEIRRRGESETETVRSTDSEGKAVCVTLVTSQGRSGELDIALPWVDSSRRTTKPSACKGQVASLSLALSKDVPHYF